MEVNVSKLERTGNRFIERWKCVIHVTDRPSDIYGFGWTANKALNDAAWRFKEELLRQWKRELTARMEIR